MDARYNEKDRLLNIDSNIKSKIEFLPQDIIDLISYYLTYVRELSALIQTSKTMREIVGNTPAGKLARQATNLEAHCITSLLASTTGRFLIFGTSVTFGITTFGIGLATALGRSCVTKYDCYPHAPTCHDANQITECSGIDSATGIPVTASLLGLTTTSIFFGCYGLFKKSQINKKTLEITNIRERLKKPIYPYL